MLFVSSVEELSYARTVLAQVEERVKEMKHEFSCLSFGRIRVSRWHCRNCGLTVSGTAANKLEGKECP